MSILGDAANQANDYYNNAINKVSTTFNQFFEQTEELGTTDVKPTFALKLTEDLQYPLSNEHLYGAKIVFCSEKRGEADVIAVKKFLNTTGNTPANYNSGVESDVVIVQNHENSALNGSSNRPNIVLGVPERGRKVTLYLPQGFQLNDKVNWTIGQLGVIGEGVRQKTAQGEQLGVSDVVGGAIGDGFAGLSSVGTSIFTPTGLKKAFQTTFLLATKNSQSAVVQGARAGTGTTLDPKMNSMMEPVMPRSFEFNFKLIPTSAEEWKEIRSIIHYFRSVMYPSRQSISTAGSGLEDVASYYVWPDPFRIVIYYINTQGTIIENITTKLLACHLDQFSATYNQTSMAMHDDGAFSEVDINITFIEANSLSREDIEVGY